MITRQLPRVVSVNTSEQYMKESSTHSGNVTTRQFKPKTSKGYMKVISTHARNVITWPLQKVVSFNTSKQYIKERSTHPANMTINYQLQNANWLKFSFYMPDTQKIGTFIEITKLRNIFSDFPHLLKKRHLKMICNLIFTLSRQSIGLSSSF